MINSVNSSRIFNIIALLSLFCLQPVVNFMATNIVDPNFVLQRSILYFFILLLILCVSFVILSYIFPKVNKYVLALGLGLTVYYLFNDFLIFPILSNIMNFVFGEGTRYRYIFLFQLIILFAVYYFLPHFYRIKPVFLAIVFMMTGSIVVDGWMIISNTIQKNYLSKLVTIDDQNHPDINITTERENNKQNIYLIVPDSLVGPKQLANLNIPNTLESGLNKLGFTIIDAAYSNSPITYYSMAHVFGMDYFLTDGETVTLDRFNTFHYPFKQTGPIPPVLKQLFRHGYKYMVVPSGFYDEKCPHYAHTCSVKGHILKKQDEIFLRRTPLNKLLIASSSDKAWKLLQNISYPNGMEVTELENLLPAPKQGPFLFYAHMMLPHPPFRYNADCDYRNRFGNSYRKNYIEQSKCATKQYLNLITSIIKQDPKAIIIFQADHGARSKGQGKQLSIDEMTEQDINENLSIFSAFRLPEQCRRSLRSGLSQVNTFRIVLACIEGRTPDLIEDRYFLAYYLNEKDAGKVKEWKPSK